MHVKIVGFKCHLDSEYNFHNNEMILLKGESGAGKSTILQAIFWCLYRSLKNVSNNTGIMKECSVTLEIDHMVIYRRKTPKLLSVSISSDSTGLNHVEYKDEIAQEIINRKFGTKELWKSCSYIVQKERCDLLKGSLSERLALLNQLSFEQDNPKDYIFKIDQELKNLNKEFIELQSAFTAELNIFSEQLAVKPVTVVLSQDHLIDLEKEINSITRDIERLYLEVLEHERNLGSYNTLTNQINSIQYKLDNIILTNYNEEEYFKNVNELNENIQFIKNAMNNLNNYNVIKNQIITLEDRRKYYENQLINIKTNISNLIVNDEIIIPNVTEQLLWNIIQTENSLARNIKSVQDLGCEYNQLSVNNMINELREKINDNQNIENKIKIYSQLKLLKQQLSQYPTINCLSDYENQKHSLALEISELKKGLELLQCPECSKPLRYLNNKLIPGERELVNPNQIIIKESEYKTVLNEINTCKTVEMLKTQIKNLEQQLINVNLEILENYKPVNIKDLQNRISILDRIEFLQSPQYSSDVIRKVLENNKLKQTLLNYQQQETEITNQINNITNMLINLKLPDAPSCIQDIKTYENELIKINKEHQTYLVNKQSYEELNKSLAALINQRNFIKLNYEATKNYSNSKKLLEDLKKKFEDANYGNLMIKRQTELGVKRESVINLNEELTALQRLKQNAIEIECKQLQDTVDTINSALNDILPLFFKKSDITIKFQLYKTLKTTKEVKPGLNISIKQVGVEYDNINDLSGGEGDRISLAVVLALNSVSNSPIILLDECISSLDGAIKEDCVEAIRTIEGKTIICIDHEGVEGFYDKTIIVNR